MKKNLLIPIIYTLLSFIMSSCSRKQNIPIDQPAKEAAVIIKESSSSSAVEEKKVTTTEVNEPVEIVKSPTPESISEKYKNQIPKQWGERVTGIKTSLDTTDKVIALTFDACGGPGSNGYDEELINYLIEEQVPATLFVNYRWIDANKDTFIKLSQNSLFEIENHGYAHSPLSVNGKSAYNISGTKNVDEVLKEVMINQEKIGSLTGRKPSFFRPGTAYSDEVAVSLVNELGIDVVGYNVLGDAGATFNREQIKASCLKVEAGSIILLHMNHPEKQTYEGMRLVLPELKSKGFKFAKLSEYKLK